MYLTLGELLTDMYKFARSASSNAIAGTAEFTRAINNAILQVSSSYPWSWRNHDVFLQTVAPYTTGTITLTANSRSVTGSSTAWDTTWTGYWLKVDNESEWYAVKTISSITAMTLETPYVGSNTGSGKTYTLYKRIYTLPSVVDDPDESLRIPAKSTTIDYMPSEKFQNRYRFNTAGFIFHYTVHDRIYNLRTYTTGTVSGTSGTQTLTGSSTAWLDKVFEGDEIEISATKYNILTVDSDTQLTLCQNLQTSPSGTSYTVRSVRALEVQFGYLPDGAYNIEIPCYKRLYKVIDNNDIIPIPTEFIQVIRYLVMAEILSIHDSNKSTLYTQLADKEIVRMINDQSIGVENKIEIERE
jgi:hypothetical protein